MGHNMRQKTKDVIHSIHWSMQQTAIMLLFMLATVSTVFNTNGCSTGLRDPMGDPDMVADNFISGVVSFALAVALLCWYRRRKRKYLQAEEGK